MFTESTPSVQVWTRACDAVPLVPWGWDIEPASPSGPSHWPSWNARSHGHLHEGRPLYVHTSVSFLGLKWANPVFISFLRLQQTCSSSEAIHGTSQPIWMNAFIVHSQIYRHCIVHLSCHQIHAPCAPFSPPNESMLCIILTRKFDQDVISNWPDVIPSFCAPYF